MCIDVVVKLHPFDAIAQSDMAGILPHMKNYKCKVQDRLFSLDHRHIYNSPYTTLVNILDKFCISCTGLGYRCTVTRSYFLRIGTTCLSHKPSLGRMGTGNNCKNEKAPSLLSAKKKV